jgi:hypothetical protein
MKIDKITGRRMLRAPRADLQDHVRKCHIRHHPQRSEIEDDFLNWQGPNEIVKDYNLPHWSVIYRHANALGLRAPATRTSVPCSTSSSAGRDRPCHRQRHPPRHPCLFLPPGRWQLGGAPHESYPPARPQNGLSKPPHFLGRRSASAEANF